MRLNSKIRGANLTRSLCPLIFAGEIKSLAYRACAASAGLGQFLRFEILKFRIAPSMKFDDFKIINFGHISLKKLI